MTSGRGLNMPMKKTVPLVCLVVLVLVGMTTAAYGHDVLNNPDLRYNDREGLLNVAIAAILVATGFTTILLYLFMLKTRDRALFYFGLFVFLYGIRIFSDNSLFQIISGGNRVLWRFVTAFITYYIPIPLFLLMKQFVGWGIKRSLFFLLIV